MPARGSLLRWAETQQMSVGTSAQRLPPRLLRPFSQRTICRSVSFRLCSITGVRIRHHVHFVEQHSFAHYGTTAMQVTINAQLRLMVDRNSNSSRERERKRERERERERERKRERERERDKEPSTGQTSQGSKGTSFSGNCTFQPMSKMFISRFDK